MMKSKSQVTLSVNNSFYDLRSFKNTCMHSQQKPSPFIAPSFLHLLPPSSPPSFISSLLHLLPPAAYHHISKTIEVSRVHLFDIVTQYRAIFPDDDVVRSSYTSSEGGGGRVEGALFYSWVNEKVHVHRHPSSSNDSFILTPLPPSSPPLYDVIFSSYTNC